MAKDGWIAIRNFPLPSTSSLRNGQSFHKILKGFFKRNRVCPKCKGRGYQIKRELDRSKVETVKYEGIRGLEKIKEDPAIIFGDKVKEIFLSEFAGKKPCKDCTGTGFVKKAQDAEE